LFLLFSASPPSKRSCLENQNRNLTASQIYYLHINIGRKKQKLFISVSPAILENVPLAETGLFFISEKIILKTLKTPEGYSIIQKTNICSFRVCDNGG